MKGTVMYVIDHPYCSFDSTIETMIRPPAVEKVESRFRKIEGLNNMIWIFRF